MKYTTAIIGGTLAALTAGSHAGAGGPSDRDIQIVNVMLDAEVIMLSNLGSGNIPLDGWRFCTQSTTQQFRYSGTSGLNGITMNPNDSLFIHLNNDAAGGANHIDASSLGGSFAGLDLTAYAISLYSPGKNGSVSFGDPTDMADHMQFSLNGDNNLAADDRTDEAIAAGLWTALDDWISIVADSLLIELTDVSGGLLHGPSDYNVTGPNPCPADFTGDGVLDIFDVFAFLNAFNTGDASADFTGDGSFDIFDVFAFLNEFNAGCP